MKRLMIAAIAAAGLFVAVDSTSAPARAAPMQAAVARTMVGDHGLIEKAHYEGRGHRHYRHGRHHRHHYQRHHHRAHYHRHDHHH